MSRPNPMFTTKVGESSRRTVLVGSATKNPPVGAASSTFDQQEYGFTQSDAPNVR